MNPRSTGDGAGVEKRILHSGDDLHCAERGADARCGKLSGQVAERAQTTDFFEAVSVAAGNQTLLFPGPEVGWANLQVAENVLTVNSGHRVLSR